MSARNRKNMAARLFDGGRARIRIVGSMTALLWLIEIVDSIVFKGRLDSFGVKPHKLEGLVGIIFAPFLHAGFGHLVANTLGFVILGLLVTSRRIADFWIVFCSSAIFAGLGCWLFGGLERTNEVHIGVSGVIFGFLGFSHRSQLRICKAHE